MSSEVYFNEPGYEEEANTEEGLLKNEGYSNIVKLATIKYAITQQIKNPSKGFEDIIRKHFYVKRDIIIKEVTEWIKMAEFSKGSYKGLVGDHNGKYANQYIQNP